MDVGNDFLIAIQYSKTISLHINYTSFPESYNFKIYQYTFVPILEIILHPFYFLFFFDPSGLVVLSVMQQVKSSKYFLL